MEEIKIQLVKHIKGGEAFITVDNLWGFISLEKLCKRPKNLPYSFYEIFYHMRFAQNDLLAYCLDEEYSNHKWPDDYWPSEIKVETKEEWESLVQKFEEERQQLIEHILNPNSNILKPINSETKNTLLREILLVIEHNAYHTGQLLIVLRSLGLYPA